MWKPPRYLQFALWRLAAVLLVFAIIGWWAGYLAWSLVIALTVVMAWHYTKLLKLLRRLALRQRIHQEQGWGIFAELTERLARSQSEFHGRKRRLLELLKDFRRAANAMPDAVLLLDRKTLQLKWFNQSGAELLQLDNRKDISRRLETIFPQQMVIQWLDQGAQEVLSEVPLPRLLRDNKDTLLELQMIDYTPTERLLLIRDISRLTKLEQIRRDFIGNVSHELRTPLTVIHGYLDMIDEHELPEHKDIFDELQRQSLRMRQLVEDLLTLSKLDSTPSLPMHRVDMRNMLTSLEREANTLSAGKHHIRFDVQKMYDLIGSETHLHSAFSNLISNAIRYTPAQGRIHVVLGLRTNTDGEKEGVFSVTDTGYGIPEHHIPRLTERFYRVSTSRSRNLGGTGLGLAIVKHVLGLHHARLEIESIPDQGSTFRCVFSVTQVCETPDMEDCC